MNEHLRFDGIGKTFPGVRALDDVSFGVREGEVRGLVGENGAGKSTLLKILSGVYASTEGTLTIAGERRRFAGTADAIEAGVAVIYQELHLVPEMSVAENLYIGHLPARFGVVDRRRLREGALGQLEMMGEDIDPGTKVGRLPIAQRQMVEIAKALTRGAKIIAFDEPTSSLSDREVKKLFSIILKLKEQGCVVFYVSHRLAEVFEICDSVTILRDGRHIQTFRDMKDVTHDVLVNRMVGRDIRDIYGYAPRDPSRASGSRPGSSPELVEGREHGSMALEVKDVLGPGVEVPASFSVAAGEILAIFGLVGSGRTELLKLVFGATPRAQGRISVLGRPVRIDRPRDAIRSGLMFCPEDRKKEGVIPIRSVQENINLSARRSSAYLGFVINEEWERRNAEGQVGALDIRTPSLRQQVMNLSGGNQQKVILARWLSETIRVILLDEPTRGIDVGAKREIYDLMYDLARKGVGVVMVSSELSEVLGVADRIMVMRQGRIVAELTRDEATEENVLKLALPVAEPAVGGGAVA